MKLTFQLAASAPTPPLETEIHSFIIAGWAGRDLAAIEHHIEELAELGVPRPSAVPLFYRVSENQLTQQAQIQAVGPDSSGEAEVFLFSIGTELFISLTSDHTDRKQEANSVALSKQLCAKPVGSVAWRFDDVKDHWDELIIRSKIQENGKEVIYQEGTLSALQNPLDLAEKYFGAKNTFPNGFAMSCGTVPAIGGIRPATDFTMELEDPHSGKRLVHRYTVEVLPEIA